MMKLHISKPAPSAGRVTLALLLGAVVACSAPRSPTGAQCGHVTLQVGRGSRPTITWQPACGVGTVLVSASDSANPAPQWTASSFKSSIVPPVVYGTKPAGAQEAFLLSGADSLKIRATYTVTVGPPVRGGITDSLRFTVQASTP